MNTRTSRARRTLHQALIISLAVIASISAAQAAGTPGEVVNVNTATVEQLSLLYRTGSVLAARIVEGRPYKSLADFDARVKGVGAKWLEVNAGYVVFGKEETTRTEKVKPDATDKGGAQ